MPDLGLLDDYLPESGVLLRSVEFKPLVDNSVLPESDLTPRDSDSFNCILLDLGSIITHTSKPDPQTPLNHIKSRIDIPLINDSVSRRICYAFLDKTQCCAWVEKQPHALIQDLMNGLETGCEEFELFIVKATADRSSLCFLEKCLIRHAKVSGCQQIFVIADMNKPRVQKSKFFLSNKISMERILWIDATPGGLVSNNGSERTVEPVKFTLSKKEDSKTTLIAQPSLGAEESDAFICILLDLGSIMKMDRSSMPNPRDLLQHIQRQINSTPLGNSVTRKVCYAFLYKTEFTQWSKYWYNLENASLKDFIEGLEIGCEDFELHIVKATEAPSSLFYLEAALNRHANILSCQEVLVVADMSRARLQSSKSNISYKLPNKSITWIDFKPVESIPKALKSTNLVHVSSSKGQGRIEKEHKKEMKTLEDKGAKVLDGLNETMKHSHVAGVLPCEWYHVLNNCHNSNEACQYLHDQVQFTPRGLEEFKRWLKRTPCGYGINCFKLKGSEGCTKGHTCPENWGCQKHKEGRCPFDEPRFLGRAHD